VQAGEVIIFRHRGETLIGTCQSLSGKKIRVTLGQNRVLEITEDRLMHATGRTAKDIEELDRFRRQAEENAETLDLREVWELLREEPERYSVTDIAAFHWGDGFSAEQYTGALLHLTRGSPFFSEESEGFVPLPDDRVDTNFARIANQQAVREEQADFLRWIQDTTPQPPPAPFTNRQRHWLQRIQQYAILGDEYEQSVQARTLLQEIRGEPGGDLQRYAFSLMVLKGIWDEDEHLDLIRYEIPVDFDPELLEEACRIHIDESGRMDLTALTVFSIDDASTQDVDDAFSVEITSDGYRIGAHIADVSAALEKDSPLDREARRRMTSLYFPDRHVPMLPPELSAGRCSLLQDRRRCATTFFFDLTADFVLREYTIVASVIVNHAKLSYEEAERQLEAGDQPFSEALHALSQAADVFYGQRIDRGAIEFERHELSIRVDADKHIELSHRRGESNAEHIVSELMILTNTTAARFFAERRIPAVYRAQEEPGFKGLEKITHKIVRRYMMLRQMKPLSLTADPAPHATLGVNMYCQITSPIRRYTDLALQRQLMDTLYGRPLSYDREAMLEELSQLERSKELGRIWNRREWHWLLKYLSIRMDERLSAVVLETRDREVLVELVEYGTRVLMKPNTPVAVEDEITVQVTQADPRSGALKVVQVVGA
jgi:exoribonuclease-2